MAKISLRAYTHEIEVLIERGQTEEAIAHCKYILKQFPKHIDTYRLLGKTYLESQRYSEAADILQRVLSSIPDDFVSQLGMSIIREDEGNLDAAIWHMERAFEVQPSNTAIQDELRRLYGRRDGVELPKVRLTRGALVRMYAKGELFSQAIGEARAAIAEDPQRIDLEIILARMYYLSGQKVEATEICSRLVSKLPYCFEGNRILAEILPSTSRAEDAKSFRQSLNALDPYAAFVSPAAPTSDQVPDNAVHIERLDWTPSGEGEQPPQWTRTAGVEYKQETSDLPDWLNSVPPSALTAAPQTTVPPFEETPDFSSDIPKAEQAEIPEWMKAAGWNESNGEEKEEPSVFDLAGEDDEDIAEAELPSWLRDMAPPEETNEVTPEEQARLDLLDSLLPPVPTQAPAVEEAELVENEIIEDTVELLHPNILEDEEAPPEDEPATLEETDIPEWLSGINATEETTVFKTGLTGELPKWLEEEFTSGTAEGEDLSDEDIPEWLKPGELDEESVSPPSSTEDTGASAPFVPDDAEIMAGIAWLESLAENQGADQETLITSPEDRLDSPPEWVTKEAEDGADTLIPGPFEVVPDAAAAYDTQFAAQDELSPADEIAASDETMVMGALEREATAEEGTQGAETQKSAAMAEETVPDIFAEGITAEEITTEAVTEADGVRSFDVDTPIDTALAEETLEEDAPFEESVESEEFAPQAAETGEIDEIDAALAWLESLAEKQGADEDTLTVLPEDRLDVPPDWVQELQTEAETQVDRLEGEPVSTEEVQSEPEPSLETPAVVEQTKSEETSIESPAAELDEEDAFAWLESLAEKQGADEGTLSLLPEDRTDTPPDWVQELQTEADVSTEIPEVASLEPDEFVPTEEFVSEPEPSSETPVIAEQRELEEASVESPVADLDDEDAFAWLESLAARQGAEEETLLVAPEDRMEKPPEWVYEETGESAETVDAEMNTAEAEDAPVAAEVPDWMQEITGHGVEETAETATTLEAEPSDWFAELPAETPAETPVVESAAEAVSLPAATVEEEVEALPDWLTELEPEQEGLQTQPVEVEAVEEDTAEPVEIEVEVVEPLQEIEAGLSETAAAFEEEHLSETELADEEDITQPVSVWAQPDAVEEQTAETEAIEAETTEAGPAEVEVLDEEVQAPWVSAEEPSPEPQEEQAAVEEEVPVAEPEPVLTQSMVAEQLMTDDLPQTIREQAFTLLDSGQIEPAVEQYNQIIESGEMLDVVIEDLRKALDRYPVDISIWQSLGDAYLRNDQVQEALDSYTKAEELLR